MNAAEEAKKKKKNQQHYHSVAEARSQKLKFPPLNEDSEGVPIFDCTCAN